MTRQRDLDIVVFGATGFVGRLVAAYLAEQAPATVRIGLAGRSSARLAAVRDSLGPQAAQWPLITADAADRESMTTLAASAHVVLTTVGPYARYGLPPVRACAEAGTDYVDLTGEVLFVRDTLEHCAATARDSGARIVHSCGFDSVPSDLSVLLLAERAREEGTGLLEDTALVVDLTTRRASILGSGMATVVKSPRPRNDCALNAGDVDLAVYRAGDSYKVGK